MQVLLSLMKSYRVKSSYESGPYKCDLCRAFIGGFLVRVIQICKREIGGIYCIRFCCGNGRTGGSFMHGRIFTPNFVTEKYTF